MMKDLEVYYSDILSIEHMKVLMSIGMDCSDASCMWNPINDKDYNPITWIPCFRGEDNVSIDVLREKFPLTYKEGNIFYCYTLNDLINKLPDNYLIGHINDGEYVTGIKEKLFKGSTMIESVFNAVVYLHTKNDDVFFDLENVLKRCPSPEVILVHKSTAHNLTENTFKPLVENFIASNEEETTYLDRSMFKDDWSFALVMGNLGDIFYNTDAIISYERGDGHKCAAIGVTNRKKKLERLNSELSVQQDKLKSVQEGTSKFEKITEKINKLILEIQKYEK